MDHHFINKGGAVATNDVDDGSNFEVWIIIKKIVVHKMEIPSNDWYLEELK